MYRCLLVFFLLFVLTDAKTQELNKGLHINVLIPTGPLVLFSPYELKFDSSFNGYVVFDNVILNRSANNTFVFIAKRNGKLQIYNINTKGDTILCNDINLKFVDPDYKVSFGGKRSGSIISTTNLERKTITVDVLNNDITLCIPINKVQVRYFKNKVLKSSTFDDDNIPVNLVREIMNSDCNMLVFDIEIKTKDRLIDLPPVIYFLDKE